MTPTDALKDRCQSVLEQWTPALGLDRWRKLVLRYTDDTESIMADNGDLGVASCAARWQYLEAEITVCLPHVARMDDAELEYHLVHELCHALVNEMSNDDEEDHEERVVTELAMAFMSVRNAAVDGRLPRVSQ